MNLFLSQFIKSLLTPGRQLNNLSPVTPQFVRHVRGSRHPQEFAQAEEQMTEREENVNLGESLEVDPEIRREQKKRIRKMLRTSATFEEIPREEEPLRDPFMSGPYVKGTKIPEEVKADHDDSIEKAPKIDPKTRTVSFDHKFH